MKENFNYAKVLPILLSVILMGIFLPYIMSISEPIEVEVLVPYAQPNLNITTNYESFSNQFICDANDSVYNKNWDAGTSTVDSGIAASTTIHFYQSFCIEQNSVLKNLTIPLYYIGGSVQSNITIYNSTISGDEPIPDTKIYDVNISQVYSNQPITLQIINLNINLYRNLTENNIFFIKIEDTLGSSAIRIYFENTNYARTLKYDAGLFDSVIEKDFAYNLSLEAIDTTEYIIDSEEISNYTTVLTLSNGSVNPSYEIKLYNNYTIGLYINENLTITELQLNGNSSIMNLNYNITILNNIPINQNSEYNISMINSTLTMNSTGLYYNYFQIRYRFVLLINAIEYNIDFTQFTTIYL